MDWYIASRTRHAEAVANLYAVLRARGHTIDFDWTTLGAWPLPEDEATDIAQQIGAAIADSDVFVMVSDPAGTDMLVELGIALASWKRTGKPCVYITGEHNRRSMMHLHPGVRHANSLLDVLREENIDIPAETLLLVDAL